MLLNNELLLWKCHAAFIEKTSLPAWSKAKNPPVENAGSYAAMQIGLYTQHKRSSIHLVLDDCLYFIVISFDANVLRNIGSPVPFLFIYIPLLS